MEALVKLIKHSLDQIKKRLTSSAPVGYGSGSGAGASNSSANMQKPFFKSDVVLQIPSINMMPALEDIQMSVNNSVQTILSVCKGVPQWSKARKSVGIIYTEEIVS